ncbi:Hypothetical predicted protein [Cloeon dipterum]|nr:Hypothetical predicted protein [Cloeon dipterum]
MCNYFNDGNFHQGMVQALMKMQRLNRLHVNLYYFQLTDLLKICKNLPRLQYLNVEFSSHRGKDKPAPEEISSCFCNLKELIFEFPFNDWLGSLCTRNLPNIEVVQYDPNKIMNWTHVRQYGKRYHDVDFPGASNLRHICVDLSRSCAAELEAMPNYFPNVTCLMVTNNSCSSLATDVKPKFDNIRNLHLFISSGGEELFDNYLITYGQNLQSLYLGHDRALTIDVEMIFKNCPILEKLSLQNVQLDWPLIEIKCFAELKELEWEINCLDGFRDSESMVLCYILSSPNLEKVKLESKGFNQNDLRILHSLIREKRILNNLHTLHVYFNFQMDVALANVLKSACAFLPKLTDFKFGNRCKFADPLKACQTTPLSDVDAPVWEMIRVFENEN